MRLHTLISLFFITLAPVQDGTAQAASVEAGAKSPVGPAVALIAAPGTDPLSTLLEVKLSEGERLRLLERRELNRVLQEHQLMTTGLADRDAVARIGRLLRADAFVLLSVEDGAQQPRQPKEPLVRVRVAETAHGLRLWEGFEAIEASQAEAVAARIAEKVHAAVSKIVPPDGSMIPVGIVDIHRVQLDDRHELLARMLPKLLSARLSREPRILVLEREDLAILLKEKQLTDGEDSAFWDSGLLIDGHLQQAGGGLEMALRWRRAGDEGTVVTPVDPNAPARAVDATAVKLLQAAVETSSLARWEPEKEAEEFSRQGELLRAHRRHENAFGPLETAYALQPQKLSYIGALFENEWELRGFALARHYISPTTLSHYSDKQLAEWVSVLVRGVRRGWETGSLSGRDLCDPWGRPVWIRSGRWTYFASKASVSSEEVRAMNRENRRIWCDVVDLALKAQPVDKRFPIWNLYGRVALPWISSDDPQEVIDNIRRIYGEMLLPPTQGGTIAFADMRCSVCEKCLLGPGEELAARNLSESQFRGSETQIRALWFAYLDELAQCDDPIVRFFAHAARAEGAGYDPSSSQTAMESWWKAVKVLTEELHGPTSPITDITKRHICAPMKDLAWRPLQQDLPGLVATWERVFEPLIQSGNAETLAWWDPGNKCIPLDSDELPAEVAQRFHELLARIETVLEADGDKPRIRDALARAHDCRVGLESQYGLVAPEKSSSTINVTMLLGKKDRSPRLAAEMVKVQWQLEGKMLYTVVAGERGQSTLARVDLTGQTPGCETQIAAHWGSLRGLAVADDVTYVAVGDTGIVVLPSDVWSGKTALNPRILTREHGLPSIEITGMTEDRGRLWLAYGRPASESGLGLYDPQTGQWESVLCSTLKGEEPFNAGRPYGLMHLAMSPSNDLFFTNFGRMFRDMQPWMGLWRLDTATRSLKHYGYCGTEESVFGHIEIVGKDCWCRGSLSLIRIDTESEEAAYVFGTAWRPARRQTGGTTRWLDCRNELFLPEDSMVGVPFGLLYRGGLDLTTSAIHGDDLWALLGHTQIAVLHRGKPFAEAQIIANDILDGQAVHRFLSTPYGLVAIGDGAVGLVETKDPRRSTTSQE